MPNEDRQIGDARQMLRLVIELLDAEILKLESETNCEFPQQDPARRPLRPEELN